MIRKIAGFMALALTTAALVSCAPAEKKGENETLPTETETSTEISTAHLEKYAEVLENMLNNKVLPNGEKADNGDGSFGEMSENSFAVADVDSDGKDELVILYSTSYMAGMTGYVYGFDEKSGELHEEIISFPSFTFYKNGLLKVDWSHNQGHGEMWPYTLFKYDAKEDKYKVQANVDSWDREIYPEGYPENIDTENVGTVYHVENLTNAVESDLYSEKNLKSEFGYEEWVKETGLDAEELEIEYMKLTEENIELLK